MVRLRHSSRASPARRTTWKGFMTALAPGSSSAVALLNPVNPSIATISMRSRHVWGWEASQVLKTRLDRPGIMSRSREGPRRSRIGVTSKMTVTYLSPYGVWPHVFIHANDTHPFAPSWIIDQQARPFGQDSGLSGTSGTRRGPGRCVPPSDGGPPGPSAPTTPTPPNAKSLFSGLVFLLRCRCC